MVFSNSAQSRLQRLALATASLAFALPVAAFAPGNLVVYRVGDGAAGLTSTSAPVFLDEFSPAGALVSSVAMPTSVAGANQPLTATGNSTSEGYLSRSVDGNYLVVTGYATPPGTAAVNATSSASVNRVVGRVDALGAFNTSTRLDSAFSGSNIRSATSVDGSQFWASGTSAASSGGVWNVALGSTGSGTQISTTNTNVRQVNIFDSQLYVGSGAGTVRLATVGSGLPTTAGQTMTQLAGISASNSHYGYFFADLDAGIVGVDTVYVASDDAAALRKYSLVAGTWTSNGTIGVSGDAYRGLTGAVSGTTVTLYAVRGGNTLVTLTDASGYNGAFAGVPTSLVAAGANTAFRGVAFSPGFAEIAPTVTATTPLDNATGVAVNSNLTISFSEPVNFTGAPTISCASSGTQASIVSGGPITFTVNPNGVFGSNEVCTVTVAAAQISDQDSNDPPNNMAADYVFDFTTALPPTLNIGDCSVLEGNLGDVNCTFAISLSSPAPNGGVTFNVTTADGSATVADNDYALTSATGALIPAGFSAVNFNVAVHGDNNVEPTQTFTANVTAIVNATPGDTSGTGTIQNDDTVGPTVNVSDAFKAEGDTTNGSRMQFTVSLTSPAPVGGVTFDITTQVDSGGANPATANSDFTTASAVGALIPEGFSAIQFNVPIVDDGDIENNETLLAVASNVSVNATPGDLTGVGTITDNDYGLSIANATLNEGNSGSVQLDFTVTLNAPAPSGGITFDYATAADTATAGTDYTSIATTQGSIAATQTTTTVSVALLGDLRVEANETFFVDLSNASVGVTITDNQALGTINNDDVAPMTIAQIQGTGIASPVAGQTVTTIDNVVTAVVSNGLYMQMAAPGDGDMLTSDAIFVFTGAAPTVVPGDRVDVRGGVIEFPLTGTLPKLTEFSGGVVVNQVGSGAALPPPLALDTLIPSPTPAALACMGAGSTIPGTQPIDVRNFECFENMRITTGGGAVSAPNQSFGGDPLAEMFMTTHGNRAYREAGVRYDLRTETPPTLSPPAPALASSPVWDGNPELFELDIDKLGLPNDVLTPGELFSAVGILGFEFGDYEFWPTALTRLSNPLPPAYVPVPDATANQVTIGSFNTHRFFDNVDDPGTYDDCATPGTQDVCPTTQQFQDKLGKLSAYVRGGLKAPAVLGLIEVENLNCAQALADRINADSTGAITYVAQMGPDQDNDPGHINNAFLVRSDVTISALTQLRAADTWTFNGAAQGELHDRPPLLLRASIVAFGGPYVFAVMVNHGRSLSGIDDITPLSDQVDAHRIRQKRFNQATQMALEVQAFQSATPQVPLVLIGDYNAFEFTDGYADVIGIIRGTASTTTAANLPSIDTEYAPLANIVVPTLSAAIETLPAGQRYSFNFGGSSQLLDHALLTSAAQARFAAFAFGRGNCDGPESAEIDFGSVLRASDHDGFVVFLNANDVIFADGFD